ncbi:hypothetical protein JCM33374_g1179 [Metschnikowia sp. JCM 33374]|nr:hypothetical protein JCM33374_g1179 [Metschnikowia sp. JCM 33374]
MPRVSKVFIARAGLMRLLLLCATLLLLYRWSRSGAVKAANNLGTESSSNGPNADDVQRKRNSFDWEDGITPEFLETLDQSTHKCMNYVDYSQKRHVPFSKGKYQYPYMRPPPKCRTFTSDALEKLVIDLKSKMKDPDLARLMENCLPNTLDTTILWHQSTSTRGLDLPETFVVTGDIHAEWLRDSARQLSVFQPLIKHDKSLKTLIKGAIRTQMNYIITAPYCNAFHPPPHSGVKKGNTAHDDVFPSPDWRQVFECKYEIDSLASFLTLTNEYLVNSDHDLSVITTLWMRAFEKILAVLQRETRPSFDAETGFAMPFYYSFQRQTNIGSETLPLGGVGNPVNFNTGLVRSAFRPSDDATILQFFIPGNAHMLSELKGIMKNVFDQIEHTPETQRYAEITKMFIEDIEKGIKEYGVVKHPKWGDVYAYEVDGYGGAIFMDDANIPSLLSLPEMGLVQRDDEVYQNTRRMILSKEGNPYFLRGPYFEGIGGPHIGIRNAWPMSLLMRMRTTDDDTEIMDSLKHVMDSTAGLGLMHESVNVNSGNGNDYTRSWFAWCNSEFGKTILHLAVHKPHLIFKKEFSQTPYDIDKVFA